MRERESEICMNEKKKRDRKAGHEGFNGDNNTK